MKKSTLLLLALSVFPSFLLASNTPGSDFTGVLKISGIVTSKKNPWVWKSEGVNKSLDVSLVSENNCCGALIPVLLPPVNLLLGKTSYATSYGREGLSPLIKYGKNTDGFSLEWVAAGTALVTIPVTANDHSNIGYFTFKMQVAAVMRHISHDQVLYFGLYGDYKGNGLPEVSLMMPAFQVREKLQTMFGGEGPTWLQDISINGTADISRFNDIGLYQIEGVYGAHIIPDSGKLYLINGGGTYWRASLPISIEYQ
ncbi:fimbrial protein [Salmonella enterica]|nr:fimbrial protein [Salmonella enterica]EBP8095949.1 fimbrial protein [Salmonella enterica]